MGKRIRLFFVFSIFSFFLSLFACSVSNKDGSGVTQAEQARLVFADSITLFTVKVVYELGAEPATGTINLGAAQTWDITRESFVVLFSTHTARTVSVPTTIAGMQLIADQGRTTWTATELVNLGNAWVTSAVTGTTATIGIIFVNGSYNGDTNILGVQFSGYPFAFVFKDIVTSVGGTTEQQKYVEQATVVHEIGHALGLVNNGVAMVASHEDAAHRRHSSNTSCVMYWTVDSKSDVLSYVTGLLTNQRNLFGAQSLSDARAYHP